MRFGISPRRLFVSSLLPILLQGCAAAPIAPVRYEVVERIRVGGAGGWDYLTFDQIRHRLFIPRGDRVQVWDANSGKVTSEIAGTAGVHGVALAQDLNRGFTSDGRANTITVFGLDDLKVVKTIAIAGINPDAILYEPGFKRVYAFNGRSKSMTVIDAVSLEVLGDIAMGGKPEGAVSDGAGHVFVNIEDTGELLSIDQATNQVRARWPLAPCTNPTGLAIDVVHQRLFSVCDNGKMVIIDSRSGRLVATVPIGDGPDGAEFDPVLGIAFSSNGQGTLTVVREEDPDRFAVVADVATQERARTMTLDPASHRIYLVTAAFGDAPAPSKDNPSPRRPMLPETFTVIVMAPK
jgi:YVTN family beta-propeller protein